MRGHKGKVAVITGAAAGIGQAYAQRLAQEGCDIVAADISAANETGKLVEAQGRKFLSCICDVSSQESVLNLAKEVDSVFGRCDILVNNAGIYPRQSFLEMTYDDWRRIMSINLDAAFLTCKAFVPGMKERGWGRVVNISSSSFATAVPNYTHYIASKGGVIGFTRALATEMGPFGITVNAIAPNLTRSQGTLSLMPRGGANSVDAEFENFAKRLPIPRPQLPDDLVGALAFLTSDDAAFMTAQTLYVDGGFVRV